MGSSCFTSASLQEDGKPHSKEKPPLVEPTVVLNNKRFGAWAHVQLGGGWRVEGAGPVFCSSSRNRCHQSHLQMAAATGTNNDVRYCSAIPGTFKCSAKITENRIPTFQLCLVKLCLEGNSVRLIWEHAHTLCRDQNRNGCLAATSG